MSTMFNVKRVQTVHYQTEYTRDAVLDMLDSTNDPDIRAGYAALSDEGLAEALKTEYYEEFSIAEKVNYDSEEYNEVIGDSLTVTINEVGK